MAIFSVPILQITFSPGLNDSPFWIRLKISTSSEYSKSLYVTNGICCFLNRPLSLSFSVFNRKPTRVLLISSNFNCLFTLSKNTALSPIFIGNLLSM